MLLSDLTCDVAFYLKSAFSFCSLYKIKLSLLCCCLQSKDNQINVGLDLA